MLASRFESDRAGKVAPRLLNYNSDYLPWQPIITPEIRVPLRLIASRCLGIHCDILVPATIDCVLALHL